jgi:hemerythrin
VNDLVWGETLSVYVDEIDDDHRKLVDLYNLLDRAVREGSAENYTNAVMEELIACTVWHFRHEERLMIQYAYEGLETHSSEHRGLIKSAKELQQQLLQDGKPVSSEDVRFLERWLIGHIIGTDMDLGSFLGEVM